MDYYNQFIDDPEEDYAYWCLQNNLKKNDFEAKKYKEYSKWCAYLHYEHEIDDREYLDFVLEDLKLSQYNDEALEWEQHWAEESQIGIAY